MDNLWAPWRMAYILAAQETPDSCIFCEFPAAEAARRREHLILCQRPRAFVMLNKFPYSNGHLLVVPRAHVPDPVDLAPDEHQALADLLRDSIAALRKALSPHGMNLGMNLGRVAGAGIDQHCHWHLVPRWNGDTNFMPVVGEVKVISEHLLGTYERLLPFFAPLGP